MNYIYQLIRDGEVIDQTSLDEEDVNHASFLFYEEFGHTKKDKDEIVLLEVTQND